MNLHHVFLTRANPYSFVPNSYASFFNALLKYYDFFFSSLIKLCPVPNVIVTISGLWGWAPFYSAKKKNEFFSLCVSFQRFNVKWLICLFRIFEKKNGQNNICWHDSLQILPCAACALPFIYNDRIFVHTIIEESEQKMREIVAKMKTAIRSISFFNKSMCKWMFLILLQGKSLSLTRILKVIFFFVFIQRSTIWIERK